MKFYKIFTILLLGLVCSFYACKNNADTSKQEEQAPLDISDTPIPPNPADANLPGQNADGVWHYTCSKGCAGGAASAGNCAVCGEPLAHNPAYHASANSAPTTDPTTPTITTSPTTTPAPNATPGQNAAGVWHYTCSKGCAGGAGSAGNCAVCGGPLAHNPAYHQ